MVHVARYKLDVRIHVHIPRVGGALPLPADVGPEPPVPASLAAPHTPAIDYEGPIASVATFGVSVDVAGANLANWICALIGTHIITALVCASKTMTKLTNIQVVPYSQLPFVICHSEN